MAEGALLCIFAFLAGLIDSVAGGGGLIQLPALLILLPSVPIASLLGTNKLASIAGTSVAATQYARHVKISWRATLPATLTALALSFMGARVASLLRTDVMRVVILLLLIGMVVYTFWRKDFGTIHSPKLDSRRQLFVSILAGGIIGFYDGFFGPGTGSFLIFVFVGIFGFNFLGASASAKIVNFATNLSAMLYFAFTDNILYRFAIPMALFNIAGSVVGTRLAILRGNRFVRVLFMAVVSALIVKLGYDTVGAIIRNR